MKLENATTPETSAASKPKGLDTANCYPNSHAEWLVDVKNKGGSCECFIDGFCTDLKPKEAGCVGKLNCSKFSKNNQVNARAMELERVLRESLTEVSNHDNRTDSWLTKARIILG